MRPYEQLIDKIATQERVPSIIAQGYVDTENDKRDPNLLLKESWGGGSHGLMMITMRTARSLGFRGTSPDLLVPETNLRYGLRYLRQMFDQVGLGSWSRAAAAYNAGPDLTPWPTEHVTRFEANVLHWKMLRQVGPSPPPGAIPPDFRRPPVLQSRVGGWTLVILLGAALPVLGKLLRRRR